MTSIESLAQVTALALPVMGWFYWASPRLQLSERMQGKTPAETDCLELPGCPCCAERAEEEARARQEAARARLRAAYEPRRSSATNKEGSERNPYSEEDLSKDPARQR